MVVDDLRVETLGVPLHALHQNRAGQAFDIAGPVIDFHGGGELATGLHASNDYGFEVGAGGIDRRAVPRGAGTENDQA